LKFAAKSRFGHDGTAILDRQLANIAHGLRCRLGDDALIFVGRLQPLSGIGLGDDPHDFAARSTRLLASRI
jgi:hypothetical protein